MGAGPHKINAYILAGGKSSRMGSDKGLLQLQGKAIIQHVIEQIRPAVHEVRIVSSNPAYDEFACERIEDQIKGAGPAEGIRAALSHSELPKVFVVSCDMPFITTAAVNYLISVSKPYQITVPLFRGKLEPVFGVYSQDCLPKWEELMKQGTMKLQNLIEEFNFREIQVDQNPLFSETFFTNINTQMDLNNAIKKLNHGH